MNFWDDRFSGDEYVYGTGPNVFFKQKLDDLTPGSILLPGEGEGRQACYAASKGWKVSAFDGSHQARRKALLLAKEKAVSIEYSVSDYLQFETEKRFDVIALIFTHMPSDMRKAAHRNFLNFLKPGGAIILQGFRKEQLGLESGGPKDADMLYSKSELETDFQDLSSIKISETSEVLDEGGHHKGLAHMISLFGIK